MVGCLELDHQQDVRHWNLHRSVPHNVLHEEQGLDDGILGDWVLVHSTQVRLSLECMGRVELTG